MHDINWIRENPEAFDAALKRRGLQGMSADVLTIDERRRAQIRVFESWKARLNTASKKIGEAKAKKDETAVQELMKEVGECKRSLLTLEQEQTDAGEELKAALASIPNLPLPAPEVPDGKDEHDNVEHHKSGQKRDYAFKPKEHFELGEALGMMDFETAAKLSGARFVVLKGGLARMERALGQLMLDVHTGEHGYTEVNPPLLVSSDTMFGTAQLPKFSEDQFKTEQISWDKANEAYKQLAEEIFQKELADAGGDLRPESIRHPYEIQENAYNLTMRMLRGGEYSDTKWLIPTAEVPLTNLVRESIVDESTLPQRYTACTPCFRAEAGAAGRDTRGMIRQHQFTKVELVSITTPEQSMAEHERMLAAAESVLKKLDLHYRVITLCAGDMGFASQKTYDIEVWLPGQDAYREISSCSICGDFQARRMNARFKGKDGKNQFVHTLNGSGVAVGRALIAVMETYQQADGSIVVPDALAPYMGGITTIEAAKK